MRDNAVERLFSLFTSSDRALAIAGDLAEERERRGWIWFWVYVVRVTFALWRNAAMEAPLRLLALSVGFEGVAALYLVSPVRAVSRIAVSLGRGVARSGSAPRSRPSRSSRRDGRRRWRLRRHGWTAQLHPSLEDGRRSATRQRAETRRPRRSELASLCNIEYTAACRLLRECRR